MNLTEHLKKVKEIRDKLIDEGYQMPLRWEEVKRAIIYNNNNKMQIKVNFLNRSGSTDIPIDKVKEELTVSKIYDDSVFGWIGTPIDNTYVTISIEDYNKIIGIS